MGGIDKPKTDTIKPLEQQHNLSATDVSRILVGTFQFSQGDERTQGEVLLYIAAKHPNWKIEKNARDAALPIAQKFAVDFTTKGPHPRKLSGGGGDITPKVAADQTDRWMGELCRALNEHKIRYADDGALFEIPAEEFKIEELLEAIISIDESRLIAHGRPNRGKISHGPHRANISQFVSYALLGDQPPGHPVFAEMFADLRKVLNEVQNSPDFRGMRDLQKLVKYHNKHNPDKQVHLG